MGEGIEADGEKSEELSAWEEEREGRGETTGTGLVGARGEITGTGLVGANNLDEAKGGELEEVIGGDVTEGEGRGEETGGDETGGERRRDEMGCGLCCSPSFCLFSDGFSAAGSGGGGEGGR